MGSSEQTTGKLQDSELGDVVRRAQEIQDQTHLMLDPHPDLEQYIRAAEEAGIDRAATMQALRERLSFPVEKFKEGEYVFAKSADGFYYVAILESLDGRQAKVQFLSGMDHHCDATDLRLFSLTPGQRVSYHSKSSGMWWEGQLVKFNRDKEQVTVSSWGDSESVSLQKVRLPRDVQAIPMTMKAKMWAIGIACALSGGVLGAILMRMMSR
jgi:hypothetical protein